MKNNQRPFIVTAGITIVTFILGCDQPVVIREQKEIFMEAEKQASMGMDQHNAFLQMMPQDEIHANLGLGNTGGQGTGMPQDEIHANLNMGDMSMADSAQLESSVDRSPLKWSTPKGWFEKKGSGMRLATFTNEDSSIETTIVSLGGSAGGLESNVKRWLGQINISVSDNELQEFMRSQETLPTKVQWPAILFDLTRLQEESSGDAPSMAAAIIDRGQSQIFIKMTGAKEAIVKNLTAFKSLIQSIEPGE